MQPASEPEDRGTNPRRDAAMRRFLAFCTGVKTGAYSATRFHFSRDLIAFIAFGGYTALALPLLAASKQANKQYKQIKDANYTYHSDKAPDSPSE